MDAGKLGSAILAIVVGHGGGAGGVCCFLSNVKEHAPPLAGESVRRGVSVVATIDHVNRAASGGCVSRLVRVISYMFIHSLSIISNSCRKSVSFGCLRALTLSLIHI